MEYEEVLEQLRERKRDTELEIKKHIDREMKNFEEETGCTIKNVELSLMDTSSFGKPNQVKVSNLLIDIDF